VETPGLASYQNRPATQKGLEMSPVVAMAMITWLIVLALGIFVGSTKNRPVLGVAVAFFLGFIGLIIIALVPRREIYYRAGWSQSR
jgi:hypothetical protein